MNRNHLASFLLLSLPFAAALAIPSPCWSVSAHALSWFTGLFGLLVVVALGAVLSRAGIILLAPAMLLGLAIILKSGDFGRSVRAVRIWLLGGLIAIAGVLALGLSPIVARFSTDGSEDRFDRWPGVLDAAGQYQPIGAGLGSFDTVYRAFEPVEWLDPTYFNHAHNDYLELWLETGWLGAAVFLSVMFWTGSRWLSAWRGGEDSKSDHLARAAGGALLLLAMHSVVDFPLRTTTVMVVAALCFGLIAAGTAERPRPGAAIVKA